MVNMKLYFVYGTKNGQEIKKVRECYFNYALIPVKVSPCDIAGGVNSLRHRPRIGYICSVHRNYKEIIQHKEIILMLVIHFYIIIYKS